MRDSAYGLIPQLNSEAGSCLTSSNWVEANIHSASYTLEQLFLKPGFAMLKQIPDVKRYLAWTGTLILNAANLLPNKAGVFTIVSPFDGSKTQFTWSELVEIILHLKPDAVLLPPKTIQNVPDLWASWPESILPFIHADDVTSDNILEECGIYFSLKNNMLTQDLLEKIKAATKRPHYVIGDIDQSHMRQLKEIGVVNIESDNPAQDGLRGTVYSRDGNIDLTSTSTAMQFDRIDEQCDCPTCSQKLSKAYLHHLLLHTPLLCHRFLIQHNVHLAQRLCAIPAI